MTALRATQKRRGESGATVLVTINPNSGVYRHGHWWKEGDKVKVGEFDAAKMVKRGLARYAT